MYDIAKGIQGIQDSFNTARVGSLARLAYEQPQQRQSALAQMYGIDPNSANAMRKEFDEQDKEQLRVFATAFVNAPDAVKPQMYERAKTLWRPKFQALGSDVPDNWQEALPTIQALAGAGSQNTGVQSTFISNGRLNYLTRDGRTVDTGQVVDDTYQAIIDPVTGQVSGYAKRGNRLDPTSTGGAPMASAPQAPPPSASGGNTIVTPQDVQGAAMRTGEVMAWVRKEIARRVANGMPVDQATSQVMQEVARQRRLSLPQAGQSAPQATAGQAPVVPQAGGQARVSVKQPEAKVETWGQPFEVMQNGKPVLIERSNTGRERVSQYQPKQSNKEPSTDASKAAGFYQRMQQSERLLSQLSAEGYDPSKNNADYFTAGRVSTNWLASPKGRQYYNAASNWIRANLRRESGAVIGEEEMRQEYATYFPMPGDDAATISQKQQLRAQTAEAVRMAGAPAERAAERNAPSVGNNYDPLGILK